MKIIEVEVLYLRLPSVRRLCDSGQDALNAEKMGIAGMNRDEIRNILENGF